jgi:hypothetical protein
MLELETGIPGGNQKNWEGTSSIQPAHLGAKLARLTQAILTIEVTNTTRIAIQFNMVPYLPNLKAVSGPCNFYKNLRPRTSTTTTGSAYEIFRKIVQLAT